MSGDTINGLPLNCLQNLPSELLFEIFSYLNSACILHSVRFVCKRFNHIVGDYLFWKNRTNRLVLYRNFPPANILGLHNGLWRSGADISWQDLSYHIEKERYIWKNTRDELDFTTFSKPHYTVIDTVKLLNDEIMISGGRDRYLVVWHISNPRMDLTRNEGSHSGWIWDIAVHDNKTFYSCGLDGLIIQWTLRNGALQLVTRFSVEKSATCVDCKPGLVVVGSSLPKVTLIDPRIGNVHPVFQYIIHKHVITDVAVVDNTILSTSEDRTLGIFDIRMMEPLRANLAVSNKARIYPRCMAHKRNMLWIGDSKGYIRLYDIQNDYKFIQGFSNGSRTLVTCLWAGVGNVISGSLDRRLRVFTPSSPVIATSEVALGGQVTSIDYRRGILAAACTDHAVRLLDTHKFLNPFTYYK